MGGDPLVRYRELQTMIPLLLKRGIHVQLVTSAFRRLAQEWATLPHMNVVVSIDGLQPEHDIRRAPATYDRILKNIAGQKITIHCTVTGQMMKRSGYLEEFLQFWTPRPETNKVWFSLFTPQIGDRLPEMLTAEERVRVIAEMSELRKKYPKLDMAEGLIRQFAAPPHSPSECVFALTTRTGLYRHHGAEPSRSHAQGANRNRRMGSIANVARQADVSVAPGRLGAQPKRLY